MVKFNIILRYLDKLVSENIIDVTNPDFLRLNRTCF